MNKHLPVLIVLLGFGLVGCDGKFPNQTILAQCVTEGYQTKDTINLSSRKITSLIINKLDESTELYGEVWHNNDEYIYGFMRGAEDNADYSVIFNLNEGLSNVITNDVVSKYADNPFNEIDNLWRNRTKSLDEVCKFK